MEALILGNGGMMPMPDRFLASAALRHHGRATLFDCGEGTQIPLKRSGFGVGLFDRLVLTHRHADHLTGVPGMLMLIGQVGPRPPVEIIALPEVCDYVRGTRKLLDFYVEYDIVYRELDPRGGTFEAEDFTLIYRPLDHRIPNLGYRYEERPRPGRFDLARAERLGVPAGPLRGALQRGESVIVGDRRVRPEEVVGPPRRGRRFAYVVDTRPCETALELLEGCDLAIVEGMFRSCHAAEAAQKMHMTVTEAAALAARAGVTKTLLTHISPRYDNREIRELEAEARAVNAAVSMAWPLDRHPIAFPD